MFSCASCNVISAAVLLVTDHAEYLDALEADVVQLPQAEPVFDALWEPLQDTL